MNLHLREVIVGLSHIATRTDPDRVRSGLAGFISSSSSFPSLFLLSHFPLPPLNSWFKTCRVRVCDNVDDVDGEEHTRDEVDHAPYTAFLPSTSMQARPQR